MAHLSVRPQPTRTASNVTQQHPETGLETLRIIEALRNHGDGKASNSDLPNVLAKLRPANAIAASTNGQDAEPLSAPTPLQLAVKCARVSAIPIVLSARPSELNARDPAGQTALHLACALSRPDIVAVLLAQPNIDDMIRDLDGKTCLEACKGPDTAQLIQVSRAQFNASFAQKLQEYIGAAPSIEDPAVKSWAGRDAVIGWLSKSRARCLDLSARVQPLGHSKSSATTLIHEAAKRRDLPVLQLCQALGADFLARDGRNKTPLDYAKDEKTRAYLTQHIQAEGRERKAAKNAPKSLRVTSNPAGQRMPSRSGYLSKWVNMAKGYKQRWFVLENGQLSYYRDQEDEGKASRGGLTMNSARVVGPSDDKLKFEVSQLSSKYGKLYLRANPLRWVEDIKLSIEIMGGATSRTGSSTPSLLNEEGVLHPTRSAASIASPLGREIETFASPEIETTSTASAVSHQPSHADDEHDSVVTLDDPALSGGEGGTQIAPHADRFDLLSNTLKAELDATTQLLDTLQVAPDPSGRQNDVRSALKQSLRLLGEQYKEYTSMVADREKWLTRRYEAELDAKALWEQTTIQAAAQHSQIEEELAKVSQEADRRKKALRSVLNSGILPGSPGAGGRSRAMSLASPPASIPGTIAIPGAHTSPPSLGAAAAQLASPPTSAGLPPAMLDEDLSDDDTDEFFEAVEAGAVPVRVESPIAEPETVPWRIEPQEATVKSLEAYGDLRTKLPITSDDRPPVSLWAILKGSIGKDLTRISFPVYFNEPTSMLQRMAEDMEFSECLDAAAQAQDSILRIAYVAAFAMSNYSSTIGRIAKPFNPMLSETFEYARLDKKYRYISEQVSHHPPISACVGESFDWRYYGEVDAKSSFKGRSFEIKPTGIAHVNLYIPKELGPGYPPLPAFGNYPNLDKVIEHYSWRKVTTSVSGFITGSPTIDHFGDMEVTNHRTGEKCILTFKPKGWRGKDACEIKGQVLDRHGNRVLDIAGRWSSQLVARRPVATANELDPDAVDSEYIQLWRNSVKPPNMPFNLTPYAITLNGVSPALAEWLPPTDCRLRPDQHAFEAGQFEKANTLKTQLEDHQRTTRKKRETGELPPHQPRWFKREVEPDTGEGYWKPSLLEDGSSLEYWHERERVGYARQAGDKKVDWKGVDPIYGEYAKTVTIA